MVATYLQKLHLFSRDVRLHLITTALIGFTIHGIWAVLFNLYLLRLGYTPEFIGLVHAVSMFVFAMFCLPAGALGTRWGSRCMLIISVTMITVGNGLLPLVELMRCRLVLPAGVGRNHEYWIIDSSDGTAKRRAGVRGPVGARGVLDGLLGQHPDGISAGSPTVCLLVLDPGS